MGGGEKLTLKIVARYADKSNFGGPPEVVKRRMDILRRYCSKQGRDFDSIVKSTNLSIVISPTEENYVNDMKGRYLAEGSPGSFKEWLERAEAAYVAGTPEECVEKLERYVDLGISLFILRFGGAPKTDDLEIFARKVVKRINK